MCIRSTSAILLLLVSSISVAQDTIEVPDAQISLIQNTFIAAPIPGVVSRVLVEEGQSVKVGHPLVQLDAEQATTELEAAKAAFEAARLQGENDVDARYARRTLEVHQQELKQSAIANQQFAGSISATDIAKLQLVVDQSRLAIEQAEHEMAVSRATAQEKLAAVKMAEARLRKHGVQSAVDGVVVEIDVEAGEWVEGGKPIVRVVSLNPVRVECFVDGRNHGSELVGRAVQFVPSKAGVDDFASKKALTGKVTFVSPELHPVTGQARLWATIDNPDLAARSGMKGSLKVLGK